MIARVGRDDAVYPKSRSARPHVARERNELPGRSTPHFGRHLVRTNSGRSSHPVERISRRDIFQPCEPKGFSGGGIMSSS